jgi:2-C-methyl-D-erythritol 4-phosphate cytidylyltransferase
MTQGIPTAAAVIVGGGSGNRFGGDKLTVSLDGKPLIAHTLSAFEGTAAVSAIVLVVPPGREEEFRTIARDEGISKLTSVIPGGDHRHESVRRGLEARPPEVELVAIHDAARPLITPDLITSCIEMAAQEGASALAVPVTAIEAAMTRGMPMDFMASLSSGLYWAFMVGCVKTWGLSRGL